MQVQALAAIIDLKQATKEDAGQVAEAQAYHARKQKQLQELQEAASNSEAHQQMSVWCTQHC